MLRCGWRLLTYACKNTRTSVIWWRRGRRNNSISRQKQHDHTGSVDAYDYASPWTKGNESRSVSESRQTTVNEVYVRPDKGAAISGARGGAPQQGFNVWSGTMSDASIKTAN